MKRGLAVALATALLLTLSVAGGAPAEPTTMVLNEVTHSVFYAPQYVAIELGFFEEQGIVIDLVNGGGSDKSMTAVLTGAADIGLMGPETVVYVYNQGKEDYPVVIGQLTRCDGSFLVGREADAAFDWQSLRGKTIIGGRVGGMPLMTLLYVLRQKGIEPDVDVNVRTDIQFNLMAGAFEGSDAEFVTLFEPTASLSEREGKGHIVAAVGAESGEAPYTAYVVNQGALADRPDLYTRFIAAVAKGQKWVSEHTPEEIALALAPQFPDSDVELLTKVAANYRAIGAWCDTPVMSREGYDRMLDIIEGAGELSGRPPFEALIDNGIAESLK
ncbi:MAG: ABC transporter substrate-binding protein [Clostridiales bacterium]|nr:ABC transporter substrate-binding protein [Clostridiales bacterium]